MTKITNLITVEDRMLYAATAAARARHGLPVESIEDFVAGKPRRDSISRRKAVVVAQDEQQSSAFAVMGLNLKISDQLIEQLFIRLVDADGVTKSDIGRAALVFLRICHALPLDSCRSMASGASLSDALQIDRGTISKTVGHLVLAGLIKADLSKRPAVIYVDPRLAWRGSDKAQVVAAKDYAALDFTRKPS